MKVGMYNRWLITLGGGEKYSLTIAQYLSEKHDVHVITHIPISIEEISSRLNLDLSKISIDIIPSCSATDLTPLTGEYDLFLNASYMDSIPSLAPHSAAIIYFPAFVGEGKNARLRYRIGWMLKNWFMIPTISEGFVQFHAGTLNFHPVDVTSSVHIKLPPSGKPYLINFQVASLNPFVKSACLFVDRQEVELVHFDAPGIYKSITLNIPASQNRRRELSIEVVGLKTPISTSSYMSISPVIVHSPRFEIFNTIFGNFLGKYGVRFQLLPLPVSTLHEATDSYDELWAISEYTKRWIKTYWKRDSAVLYPPVDVENFTPYPKKKQILSVGRFFAGGHNKKHLEMVKAFKGLVDRGLKDWELHLVGGTTPGDIHKEYLADVISEAANYPIYVHPDLAYPKLRELYNESAIYWHAGGYGEDENRDPVKFEHFGITTVEGMAAGCVPVVIAKGGQPEIVRHGVNGFLWSTLDELMQITWDLIADSARRQAISSVAIKDSRKYSIKEFHKNLSGLLAEIGVKD